MTKRLILIILCCALFWWCSPAHDHEEGDKHGNEATAAVHEAEDGHDHEGEAHEGEAAEGHDHLHVPAEKTKQWGISLSHPLEREYVDRIQMTGTVTENEARTFLVNSLIEGTVTRIFGDIGNVVKEGEPLCQVNSSELLDKKTRYIQSFQRQRLERENYLRAKKLFDIKAVEQKELLSRESAYKVALADYLSLESELRSVGLPDTLLQSVTLAVTNDHEETLKQFLSPFCTIPAPAGGVVMTRDVKLGQRIEKDRTIFLVSDLATVWVLFDALEKDLPILANGAEVAVTSDTFKGRTFTGTISKVLQQLDPQLRTFKVRVEVANTDLSLKPGMYVRGTIVHKTGQSMLAVPPAALVKISGINGVFVKDGDGFRFKPLEIGLTDADGYVFARGLDDHDEVAVDGAFYLKAEYELARGGGTSADHGHAH